MAKTGLDDINLKEFAAIANLTENSTVIGGTNDGNLPDLTPTVGADLASASAAYVEAEADAAVARINALKVDNATQTAAIRELAAKVNAILTALKA